jgi:ribosome biogenesis GTPase
LNRAHRRFRQQGQNALHPYNTILYIIERFTTLNTFSANGDAPCTGVVYKKSTGLYHVNADGIASPVGNTVLCAISTKLRKHLVYPPRDRSSLGWLNVEKVEDVKIVDPVAIGDEVYYDPGMGQGMITDILPRRTKMTRRAPGKKPREQVVVANVDQIVVTIAASRPVPDLEMLDRYLISAEASEIPATIVVTKWDEEDDRRDYIDVAIHTYRAIGYPVIVTSAIAGIGLDAFKAAITGRFSVLLGMSGVGKSSLLNAIQPGLGLRVGDVSEHHGEGRHTTTHLEMFALEDGGSVVDTPGMREFGLWEVPDDEIIELFPEVEGHLGDCKFNDCTHCDEPKCAIRQAVADGVFAESRYRSYVKIRWPD